MLNNPINLTDPSGFDASGCIGLECLGGGGWDGTFGNPFEWIEEGVQWIFFPHSGSGTSTPHYASGAPMLSVSVDSIRVSSVPTGPGAPATSIAGPSAEAWATSANEDGDPAWREHRVVQVERGFAAGLALGAVPFAAPVANVLTAGKVLAPGTRPAQFGRAIGEIVAGIALAASGITGEVVGTGLSVTGIGALIGVPAMALSAGLVTAGGASIGTGLIELSQALMSKGSGGGASAGPVPNPYGKMGGPAHQAKVNEVAEDVRGRGLRPSVEHKVDTPGGAKGSRYHDM